jgi:hypothetical protein
VTQARAEREELIERAVERARAERFEREIKDVVVRSRAVDRVVGTTTLERAQELCEIAWLKSPYERDSNTGSANVRGNCEGKSLWLQQQLGGVVMTGRSYYSGKNKMDRHAVLVVPIAGKLYVCDWGKVMPIAEYHFFFEGAYERDSHSMSAKTITCCPHY